jgi:hypothetical protein
MVQQRFCRLLEHAETDSWHLGVCLRVLGSCGGTTGLRILVHSLDRPPLADRALGILAGNTSLSEDEQRKYFGGLPPQAIREQAQLNRGWQAWWDEHAADIYWHPTNHVWTTRRGEFWHVNSELAPPWQPPLPLYFIPVIAIVGIVWLLQVSGLSRLAPDRRRLRSRTHSWRNERAQFVLFLAVLSPAATILVLPARMLLGERWGCIGVSVAVLFFGSVLSVGAATRLVRRSTRGDESQLSETRVPVAWLTGAGLLTVGTELLLREEYGRDPGLPARVFLA